MTVELRQWAIERAIACGAGPDPDAVVKAAAAFVAFVEGPAAARPARAKRGEMARFAEEALDAGLAPREAAAKIGVTAGAVSTAYLRLRRQRGIAPLKNAAVKSARKNGTHAP